MISPQLRAHILRRLDRAEADAANRDRDLTFVFVGAGYLLGENWHRVESYAGIFQKLVLLAVAIATTLFVVTRLRHRTKGDPEATEVLPRVRR